MGRHERGSPLARLPVVAVGLGSAAGLVVLVVVLVAMVVTRTDDPDRGDSTFRSDATADPASATAAPTTSPTASGTPTSPGASSPATPSATASSVAPTASPSGAASAMAMAPTVAFRVTGTSWIEVRGPKGQVMVSRTFHEGETKSFSQRQVRVTVGNAGAVRARFNGMKVKLGVEGEVREVTVMRGGD